MSMSKEIYSNDQYSRNLEELREVEAEELACRIHLEKSRLDYKSWLIDKEKLDSIEKKLRDTIWYRLVQEEYCYLD